MKDFEELHKALTEMIEGRNTMNVPARENEDADLILAQGIKEHKAMFDALSTLVELKDWKDKNGKDETYLAMQPEAWKTASKVLHT